MKPELARRIDQITRGLIKPDYDPLFFSPTSEEIAEFMGEGWAVPDPESFIAIENNRAGNTVVLYREPNSEERGFLTLTISPKQTTLELTRPYSFPGQRDLWDTSSMVIYNVTQVTLHDWRPNDRRLMISSKDGSFAIDSSLRLHVRAGFGPGHEALWLSFGLIPLLRREVAKSSDAWYPSPR